jgi:hypothetical protein
MPYTLKYLTVKPILKKQAQKKLTIALFNRGNQIKLNIIFNHINPKSQTETWQKKGFISKSHRCNNATKPTIKQAQTNNRHKNKQLKIISDSRGACKRTFFHPFFVILK